MNNSIILGLLLIFGAEFLVIPIFMVDAHFKNKAQKQKEITQKINEIAAKWWSDRFLIEDKRELLRLAILESLPDDDWITYLDYDPQDLFLEIIRKVVPCRGYFYSGKDFFSFTKSGLKRIGNKLYCKEGYAANWEVLYPNGCVNFV